MSSTYSPDLRLQLISTGDQAGAWGNTTNINLGTLLEGAIAGWQQITISATPQALTANNGSADQARLAMLQFTGASSAFTVYAPPNSKQYVVYNNTSYTATIGNATTVNGTTSTGGSTVTIPAGATTLIYTDGTNFLSQINYLPGSTTVNGSITATNYVGPGTGLTGTASSLNIGGNANTSTYLAGGGAGYLPYQSSSNTTTFLAPGTNGYVLTLASGVPTWAAGASTGVTSITGTANQITASASTGAITLSLPSTINVNTSGNAATATTAASATTATTATNATNATNATTATNIAGGGVGYLPYQSSAGTTTFLAPGTSGYILQSNGSGAAPSWVVNSGGGSSGVSSFSAGSTGLAPSTGTTGAVTLSGTLNVSSGGTGGTGISGVVYGNGTSAMTAATAAQVVATIGATAVSNATNATTATSATQITNSGGWNITPSGTKLYFSYNGTNVGSLDSSGNFIAKGNVTANGTP